MSSPTMEREVRYCTTEDGVRIAYSIEGSGPPILLSPMILESFLLEHMRPEYRRFSQRLAERCQVIQYNPRGTGSSEKGEPNGTLDGLVRDVEAVIRATGLDRVSLCGRATLGPAAISFTARHGEMVDRLILYSTSARILCSALTTVPPLISKLMLNSLPLPWRRRSKSCRQGMSR